MRGAAMLRDALDCIGFLGFTAICIAILYL